MSEIFKYLHDLQGLSPGATILIVTLVVLIVVFSKISTIIKFIKWIFRIKNKKATSCGDCVLILFGIREKFEYESNMLNNSLLRKQMTFVEQKIQEITLFLTQNVSDYISTFNRKNGKNYRTIEFALYCESLKNAMMLVKNEMRRSFKENGFSKYTEMELSYYVNTKTSGIITIIKTYLDKYYLDNDRSTIRLKATFRKIDELYRKKINDWVFEIFKNSKDLYLYTDNRNKEINEELKSEIDKFVIKSSKSVNC